MQKGFTLIELMIVIAVVAVLAMIAIPSYQQYRIKVNRTDMRTEMMQMAQNLQRYQVANKVFTNAKADLGFSNDKSFPITGTALYTINLAVDSDNRGWTLTATPITTALQKNDGNLIINHRGEKCWTGRKTTPCTTANASSSWDDK